MRRRPRGAGSGGGGGGGGRAQRDLSEWNPKTKLGRMVLKGELSTMGEALRTGLPVREPEIVDILLPETEDEVLDVNMVQRMTDSGRRVNFVITCVVGNKDGFVGLGRARGREVGPSIRRAIDNAKLNMIEVKRGCGSWECGCYRSHSLPFKVRGDSGSVEVTLKPAPQGVGLAVGDIAKGVLRLAGGAGAGGGAAEKQGGRGAGGRPEESGGRGRRGIRRGRAPRGGRGRGRAPHGGARGDARRRRGGEGDMTYAVVRIRGKTDLSDPVADTLTMLHLTRQNHCVLA